MSDVAKHFFNESMNSEGAKDIGAFLTRIYQGAIEESNSEEAAEKIVVLYVVGLLRAAMEHQESGG